MQAADSIRPVLTACLIGTLTAAPGPAAPAQVAEEIADRDIRLAIEAQLVTDERVDANRIDVVVENGVVTLAGEARSLLASERAVEVARSTRGVLSVVDRIEVRPRRRPDAEIREDVRLALLVDPATETSDVEHRVESGFVTLRGTVESWAEYRLVQDVVKGVRGVRGTDNNLVVDFPEDRPDVEIVRGIERRLANSVWVDDGTIAVTVEDGRVTLSGTVGSAAERTRAMALAHVAGVTRVDAAELEVEPRTAERMRRSARAAPRDARTVRDAVRGALELDPRVEGTPAVTVEDGVVTLSGSVASLRAKRAAVEDAGNTVGVRRVRDLLKVRPARELSEVELTDRVEAALRRDPYLERHDFRVSAVGARVFLEGSVDSYYEKSRATDVVSRVGYVSDVVNQLKVETGWPTKDDWAIQQDVRDQLIWNPWLDASDIRVDVYDGVVVLDGSVDSWFQLEQARQEAFDAGARNVRVRLEVAAAREEGDG